MGRAPNPGAPQRVSAHVVPKAQAFSEDDEKTTIESGWEDEASTTVEQGEVAEKLRALGLDQPRSQRGFQAITSTNGNSVVDEPTVDDQRANAALPLLTPPSLATARLVVTQGNDLGQHLEVSPGRGFTIGRSIDNDFVLTDIAVSRKHFDLRYEGGSWVLADRGSGNGTLINGNLEDQPFMLANGDAIEIGNTTFRFEQANAPPRAARPAPPAAVRFDDLDEEEPSTVAGKPLRTEEPGLGAPAMAAPIPAAAAVPLAAARVRPKTVPPPAPLPRPRGQTSQPIAPLVFNPPPQPSAPLPGMPPHLQKTALAMPQPQLLGPIPGGAPSIGRASGSPVPLADASLANGHSGLAMGGLSAPKGPNTTLQGQGPPVPPQPMPYSYPSVADMHKHAQMLVVSGAAAGRDATSTALVPPTPFGAPPAAAAPAYAPPVLSRQTRLLLAAVGLTLLAAILTFAIIQGGDDPAPAQRPSADPATGSAAPTVTPIEPAKAEVAKPEPPRPEPGPVKVDPPTPEPAKVDPPTPEPVKPEPAKVEVARPEPPKPEPEPVKPEPAKVAKETPKETAKELAKKPKPPVRTVARTVPPKPDKIEKPEKVEKPEKEKRVATAERPDSSGARSRASELYRARKFTDAAAVLRQFASTITGTEASDLRTAAGVYEQLGVAYNRGMAPATKAVEAYKELRKALNLDSGSAAGEFTSEIKARLAQIAPKAAISFVVAKEYDQAYQAVRTAESGGVSNSDTKLVRQKLEQIAAELYATAKQEIGSNPEAAKQKLKQLRGLVDAKHPLIAKANALLASN